MKHASLAVGPTNKLTRSVVRLMLPWYKFFLHCRVVKGLYMRKIIRLQTAAVFLVTAISVISIEAVAQLDDGCDVVNGVSSPVTTGGIDSLDQLSWQAGETISATVYAPTGGATTVRLELDGSTVTSAAIPGTVSYEFAADGDARFHFLLDSGAATWELSCSQPVPPGPPKPVPTMSAYGLVLTMLGLLLVATRRLRASARRKKA
jgi:hypothetical protein